MSIAQRAWGKVQKSRFGTFGRFERCARTCRTRYAGDMAGITDFEMRIAKTKKTDTRCPSGRNSPRLRSGLTAGH
jgi:hypothetical protein